MTASEAMAPGHAGAVIWRWPPPARHRIGSVFQDPEHQFLTGRVCDELALGPIRAGLTEVESAQRAKELANGSARRACGRRTPSPLSGGEKRRLSVATALATAPRAVILDEPTFGQDRRTWDEMLSLLAGLVDSGRAVVMATHDRALVDAWPTAPPPGAGALTDADATTALANPTARSPPPTRWRKARAAVIVMAVAFASRDPVTPASSFWPVNASPLALTGIRPADLGRLIGPFSRG